ncbi:MAG TPA: hypothetical protein PK110_09890 [Niabella sp.]|jgi:hypothetical protein|nr:hypothetical protein [Chitinophagaceae bacterium]HRN46984.1 hypothetical protein [Niabella sp.]HRO85120.1 hypothetical protein [Niabella sp.]HUN01536.1 hypothetical protein [Niabella sp.]
MSERISKFEKFKMQNPVIQFFKFFFLNFRILNVVAKGHGGTRDEAYKDKR